MNEVLVEVRDLLEDTMGSGTVNKFYAGDVGLPYANALPAVIVRERYTEIARQSTAKDMYRFGISILVVMDMCKSLATAGLTDNIVLHRKTLRNLMEQADSDGAPLATTVLGALMKQASLRGTNYVYNLNGRINYDPPAPQGFFYVAAELTLDVLADYVTRKA